MFRLPTQVERKEEVRMRDDLVSECAVKKKKSSENQQIFMV